ncbi:GNAT family N-acetyltransferase [Vagococcus elongatus]|uniref:GNAT family N-acetyltransferase n=1 Tax=Vagococcus elongatus TaxID=180344 RepID=A0A430AX61_9ENTE|nr:GNAT family protein [Vagococcus elongatus]RSU12652.1 GNAT family N-acetyltransferase [Vagococcus elongatus]
MTLNLNGKNLTLRSIKNEDLETLWQIAYNQSLEWMNWNGPYFNDPVYTYEEFILYYTTKVMPLDATAVIVVDEQPIGLISHYWEDGELMQWLEYGLVIYQEQHWGKGIGTEACKIWMDYLFDTYPYIQRVGFTTWSGNHRILRMGEKLGMKKEAVIRQVRFWQGNYYDSVKFGILRKEWQENI